MLALLDLKLILKANKLVVGMKKLLHANNFVPILFSIRSGNIFVTTGTVNVYIMTYQVA